jgi:mannose-6-phosphate isomerase class I
VTLRYWDHGRRYDAQGRLDDAGRPRELHVEDALAVTDWSAPRGTAALERTRLRAGAVDVSGEARCESLTPPGRDLESMMLEASRVSGTGECELGEAPADALVGLFVAEGEVVLRRSAGELRVPAGRSAVLPARMGERRLRLEGAHGLLASVRD